MVTLTTEGTKHNLPAVESCVETVTEIGLLLG